MKSWDFFDLIWHFEENDASHMIKKQTNKEQTNLPPAAATRWMSTRGLCWCIYMGPAGAGAEPTPTGSASILQYPQSARVL